MLWFVVIAVVDVSVSDDGETRKARAKISNGLWAVKVEWQSDRRMGPGWTTSR